MPQSTSTVTLREPRPTADLAITSGPLHPQGEGSQTASAGGSNRGQARTAIAAYRYLIEEFDPLDELFFV
jgi:hypothetical protein